MPADATGGERPVFGSAWGVVLTTAGAAIGLGNIWRFPYMMGEYGGSAFLVLYLLLDELGRHSRMPVTPLLVYWMKFVVPLGIAVIFVYGWWDALGG